MHEPNHFEGLPACYHTLGCKLNFAETASLRDRLGRLGVRDAAEGEPAGLCIVNTCSVTDVADQKCRQTIRRIVRQNPGALVVVMGCYAQLQPARIAQIEGVGIVVGAEDKGRVPELIAECLQSRADAAAGAPCHMVRTVPTADIRTFAPSCSRGERTRYFLKVQDGCNYRCSYCTIPMARGRSRNGSIASIVAQAEEAAAAGGREIVITGVNTGDFGRTTGERFADLLRALDGVRGICRYRISSIEPNLLTDEVLDFCAASRAFMPHFHVPLQSGSDRVLRLMRRRYDTALFAHKVERIRRILPDAFIGVDVIAGMRGETEADFAEACDFVRSLDISRLHVFTYSERPGTPALDITPAVEPQEKHRRTHVLMDISEQKRTAFYRRFEGTRRPVLWEGAQAGHAQHGFTDNYLRVELPAGLPLRPEGSIETLRLGALTPDGESLQAQG